MHFGYPVSKFNVPLLRNNLSPCLGWSDVPAEPHMCARSLLVVERRPYEWEDMRHYCFSCNYPQGSWHWPNHWGLMGSLREKWFVSSIFSTSSSNVSLSTNQLAWQWWYLVDWCVFERHTHLNQSSSTSTYESLKWLLRFSSVVQYWPSMEYIQSEGCLLK